MGLHFGCYRTYSITQKVFHSHINEKKSPTSTETLLCVFYSLLRVLPIPLVTALPTENENNTIIKEIKIKILWGVRQGGGIDKGENLCYNKGVVILPLCDECLCTDAESACIDRET